MRLNNLTAPTFRLETKLVRDISVKFIELRRSKLYSGKLVVMIEALKVSGFFVLIIKREIFRTFNDRVLFTLAKARKNF